MDHTKYKNKQTYIVSLHIEVTVGGGGWGHWVTLPFAYIGTEHWDKHVNDAVEQPEIHVCRCSLFTEASNTGNL